MSDPDRPVLEDVRKEVGSLRADVQELATLHWELAETEVKQAVGPIKRLTISLVVAAVTALSGLPVLAVCVADLLRGWLGISFAGWLAIVGFGLLAAAGGGGWLAWRRFRHRFVGLQQTLEELHEDLVWLRDATGQE